MSSTAAAESDLAPYASVNYAYQSNPLYQWSGTSAHLSGSSDSLLRLEGGADARFVWSRHTLTASAVVRRFEYERLDYLVRTEEIISGNYEWSATSNTTAGASYRHERRMVPFDELGELREPLMESENTAALSLKLGLPAAWQIASRLESRDITSPRPGAPDLALRETAIREELRRPLGGLSLGLDGEYRSGSYHGAGSLDARDYRQITVELVGARTLADFSTFSAALGYTTRDGSRGAGISTLTGLLSYERNLTGKTAGAIFLRRAVNNYLTGASGEVDTGGGVRASWQPTGRMRAEVSLVLTVSEWSNSGGAATSRRDRYEVTTIQMRYQVFERLSVGPYGRYAARSSNTPAFGFNAKEIGIELALREPK